MTNLSGSQTVADQLQSNFVIEFNGATYMVGNVAGAPAGASQQKWLKIDTPLTSITHISDTKQCSFVDDSISTPVVLSDGIYFTALDIDGRRRLYRIGTDDVVSLAVSIRPTYNLEFPTSPFFLVESPSGTMYAVASGGASTGNKIFKMTSTATTQITDYIPQNTDIAQTTGSAFKIGTGLYFIGGSLSALGKWQRVSL